MTFVKRRLGDVFTLKRGHDLPDHSRLDGDVPVVSSSGITGFHNVAKASAPGVVTGRYGTIGEVFYMEQEYWPLNTALYIVDFKGTHPKFAAYFLRNVLRDYQSDKAAVPGVDRNVLHAMEVKVPNKVLQARLAEMLTSYDDLIENNKRRIALLEDAARELYVESFVRRRYPGDARIGRSDTLRKGWSNLPLREIATVNRAILRSSFQGELDYVDISAVTPGHIGETTRYDFPDAPSRARRIVQHGDIIWSCVRPNRRSHAVIWNPRPNLIVSTGFAVLTPEGVPTSYLYQATTTEAFVRNLENRARGAAYPAVVASDFEESEVVVPPASFVARFNDFAEPLLGQIHNLTSQNQKLRTARDLLLPRLMSGEIAV